MERVGKAGRQHNLKAEQKATTYWAIAKREAKKRTRGDGILVELTPNTRFGKVLQPWSLRIGLRLNVNRTCIMDGRTKKRGGQAWAQTKPNRKESEGERWVHGSSKALYMYAPTTPPALVPLLPCRSTFIVALCRCGSLSSSFNPSYAIASRLSLSLLL